MTAVNDTLKLIAEHTTTRSFTDEPVSKEMREAIFNAARAASSTCFLQETSVIRVTDPAKKQRLSELAGNQKHVAEAPEFWVFLGDMHRNKKACPAADTGWAEQLMVVAMDCGIFAQNAMIALESLGLGGCYIGGIRNNIEEVTELLELPELVIPIFGIAFGHPKNKNELKPRLPATVTMMENRYEESDETVLAEYDELMREYFRNRAVGSKDCSWSETLPPILERERRPFMLEYLKKQGFCTK